MKNKKSLLGQETKEWNEGDLESVKGFKHVLKSDYMLFWSDQFGFKSS